MMRCTMSVFLVFLVLRVLRVLLVLLVIIFLLGLGLGRVGLVRVRVLVRVVRVVLAQSLSKCGDDPTGTAHSVSGCDACQGAQHASPFLRRSNCVRSRWCVCRSLAGHHRVRSRSLREVSHSRVDGRVHHAGLVCLLFLSMPLSFSSPLLISSPLPLPLILPLPLPLPLPLLASSPPSPLSSSPLLLSSSPLRSRHTLAS